METELYTNKSTSACIRAAYTLLTTNIKTIFKRLWLPALANAIMLTLSFMLYIPDKGINDWGHAHPLVATILISASYLLTVIANIWLTGAIASMLNGSILKKNIFRAIMVVGAELIITTISIFIISFGTSFVASILASSKITSPEHALTAGHISAFVIFILFCIFTLPFVFSTVRYQIDHKTRFSEIFRKGYGTGFRHWGFQFITYFVGVLLTIVACFIAFIPLIIISSAQIMNQLGLLAGDPNGAPGYFVWLLMATVLITMFLLCFILVWTFFIVYYTYGSVEAKDLALKAAKEKAIANNNKNENEIE